jgi:RNA polymerase sigma factor (sigma-70 family)
LIDHERLLWRVLSVDAAEQREIYEAHAPAVYHYLLKIFRSDELAEDHLQEVFFRFFKLTSNKPIEKVRSYLFRIAHNLYVDFISDKSRREKMLLSLQEKPQSADFTDESNWKLLKENILEFLQQKKEALATAFILRIDHEMTYLEIATALDVSERTIIRYFQDIQNILTQNFKKELHL